MSMRPQEQPLNRLYAQYPLISSHDIRLLLLHPPPKGRDSPVEPSIVCDLEVVSLLNDQLSYEALSYTWGPPIEGQVLPNHDIALSSCNVSVRANLYHALRRFQHPTRTRRLWIDALCIDQENLQERGQQVSIMAKIYSRATATLVWLGEDTEEHDGQVGMALFRAVDQHSSTLETIVDYHAGTALFDSKYEPSMVFEKIIDGEPTRLPLLESEEADIHSILSNTDLEFGRLMASPLREHYFVPEKSTSGSSTPPLVPANWTDCRLRNYLHSATTKFIRRTYFRRKWVIQELFHARGAQVYCGQSHIQWHKLSSSHGILRRLAERMKGYPLATDMLTHGSAFRIPQMPPHQTAGGAAALLERLHTFMWCQCGDARDQLYALLNFDCLPHLWPDYGLTVSELWIKFATDLVNDGILPHLLFLAAGQYSQVRGYTGEVTQRKRPPGLPSWVPDFQQGHQPLDRLTLPMHSEVAPELENPSHVLSCTLRYVGEIVYVNGWALLGPIVDDTVYKEASAANRGPGNGHSKMPPGLPMTHPPGTPRQFVWARSPLRAGDVVCRARELHSPARGGFIALRPIRHEWAELREKITAYTLEADVEVDLDVIPDWTLRRFRIV